MRLLIKIITGSRTATTSPAPHYNCENNLQIKIVSILSDKNWAIYETELTFYLNHQLQTQQKKGSKSCSKATLGVSTTAETEPSVVSTLAFLDGVADSQVSSPLPSVSSPQATLCSKNSSLVGLETLTHHTISLDLILKTR